MHTDISSLIAIIIRTYVYVSSQAGGKMFVESVVRWGAWSVLLQFGLGVSAGGCPPPCVCRPEAKEVICSGKHLNSVLEGFSSDARHLDLSYNKIKTVGRRQFSGLQQLQELDLSDNIISMIEVEAFQGLQNLRTLRIKNNRLKIIKRQILQQNICGFLKTSLR